LHSDLKAAKKMRLPWWGVLSVIVGSLPIAWLLDHFGRFDLARPVLYSIGTLGFILAIKWGLRRHLWFWITVAALAAFHVLLVLLVPWNTGWVPAVVVIPIALADFYAMLAIFSVVERLVGGPQSLEDKRPRA
jgi:cellulose synthase/poly-beta-1,6-N-acetylglucosamine synthase-like glycosyltransferase